MTLNIKEIKKNFPIFAFNPKLVYLDTTASSLKPKRVVDALDNYYQKFGVNIHRGVYGLSFEATALYENAREKVARFINASPEEVIFTRGTTSALNMVALNYLKKLTKEDEIITSELEHHSSFLPWFNVSKKTKAKLRFVELDENGNITVENFKKVLTKKTKIVALTYVSNVMGRIQPIKEIVKLAKEVGATTIIDAAQAPAHFLVDVKDLGCDFLAFSGHKMMGPTGIGVLYIKKDLCSGFDPIEFGGEMADLVEKDNVIYKTGPHKYEAGTPIIAGAIGLGSAIDFINELGYNNIKAHINDLYNYTINKLNKIEGITIYNPKSDTGIITFNIDNVHPHDVATIFDKNNICIRAGRHCAHLIVKWLNQAATLRISLYIYNTYQDIDLFIKTLLEARDFFKKF